MTLSQIEEAQRLERECMKKNYKGYENGKKGLDGNYKDGKYDGKWTYWYENGQKKEGLVSWLK